MANPVRIVIEASSREAVAALAEFKRRAGEAFSGAARSSGTLDAALDRAGNRARELADQAAGAGGGASRALTHVRDLGEGWAGVVASMRDQWREFIAIVPAFPSLGTPGPIREAGAGFPGQDPREAAPVTGFFASSSTSAGNSGRESGPQATSAAWGTAWDEIRGKGEETWEAIRQASDRTMKTFQNSVVSVVMGASGAGEAVKAVVKTMAEQVLGAMVSLGVQRLILSRISLGAQATETTSQVAGMSAIAVAAAPAAA
ncbi:MAG: hypothetical protein ABIJ95_03355, partial [Pseudomonadota bacterium]